MGRYLSTNLCSGSVNKTLRSYCKLRYLMSLIRKQPRLARAPPGADLGRNPPPSPLCPLRLTRRSTFKKQNGANASSSHGLIKEAGHQHQQVRFYSSPNRNALKAEAPVGIFEVSWSSLGRLGHSFNRLSRHINVYFKRKDAENTCLVVAAAAAPDYLGRSQRRNQSQRAAREQKTSEGKEATLKVKQEHYGLQLFHISALATAFGESYSYVASHINSAFSGGFSRAPPPETLEAESSSAAAAAAARATPRRQKRRKVQKTYIMSSTDGEPPQVSSAEANAQQWSSGSWEEGYLHFARHINKYFGAKVADDGERLPVEKKSRLAAPPGAASEPKQDGGLFHSSHQATHFGESYFQTAGHINQYFTGQSGSDEDVVGSPEGAEPQFATPEKTVSFMDCLRHPTSAIPDFLGSYLNLGPLAQTGTPRPAVSPKPVVNKKLVFSRRRSEETTRALIGSLAQAPSPEALTACVESLNEHLIRYPSCKALMWQEKTAVTLLRKRRAHRDNAALQSAVRESLALIGYVDPVKGRGIRVLSIDGGGTRGVVPLQVLKLLEAETGKKIYQLFDYICGVSTGAVLAFMLGLAHFSLEECADMYRRFGSEVFRQNPLVGTVKMGWSHSYYNTETWEAILQEKLGSKILIKTAGDELSPKVSAVSAVVNWGMSPKAFVFRNYNHKPGSLSRYAGVSGCQMWQAVRASSAAPGYFQEFPLQSDIHQDGGILLNNPCALAVHESRLLWPDQPFQCVLSLGTGRYDNVKKAPGTSTSLRAKIGNLICSATDTEGVHTLLDELLAPDVYFRFNPMLSAMVTLDESRPRALDQLQRDTQSYLERNRPKLARLCLVLGAERSAASRTKDWMSQRAWEVKQSWV